MYSTIKVAVSTRFGPGTSPPKFYYDSTNINEQPTTEWDMSLGNMGLIPKYVEKWLSAMIDEEKQHTLKYAVCDISQAVMQVNQDIWKHRCRILYAGYANNNPP